MKQINQQAALCTSPITSCPPIKCF